jgi:hypothetical protein
MALHVREPCAPVMQMLALHVHSEHAHVGSGSDHPQAPERARVRQCRLSFQHR